MSSQLSNSYGAREAEGSIMQAAASGPWSERYGWMVLVAGEILGLALGLVFAVFGTAMNPEFQLGRGPQLLQAFGIVWAAFAVLALAVTVTSYRKGERWAWWALWLVPIALVAINPDSPRNLVVAAVAVLGLLLPSRKFFRQVA